MSKRITVSCLAKEVARNLGGDALGTNKIIQEFLKVLREHVIEGDEITLTSIVSFGYNTLKEKTQTHPKDSSRIIRLPERKNLKVFVSDRLRSDYKKKTKGR
jgi:nucleoid DNA-binding protein